MESTWKSPDPHSSPHVDSQPLHGTDRIRSLKDQDSIFQAFDSYPWTKDKDFLSGLSAILDEAAASSSSTANQDSPFVLVTHARVFYYAQRIGVHIEFATYQTWLAQNPHHQPPEVIRSEFVPPGRQSQEAENEQLPSIPWQNSAPKVDLSLKPSLPSELPTGEPDAEQPKYPIGFTEFLRLIHEGKPIPGIRQIPDTVVQDPSIKPIGTRVAPRKPWEKNSTHAATHLLQALDLDFPLIDNHFEKSQDQNSPSNRQG